LMTFLLQNFQVYLN
jgi:hypothetical protein